MKNRFFIIFLMALIGISLFYKCNIKNEIKPKGVDSTSKNLPDGKNPLSTIPGNNYFNTTLGGGALFVNDSTFMEFGATSGKCDTASGAYVISMKSESTVTGLTFTSVYFKTMPTVNDTLTLVPYNLKPLGDTSAWATITTVLNNKTWRAVNGKVYVSVTDSLVSAQFDMVKTQNMSNITDTAYIKMSGKVFCK